MKQTERGEGLVGRVTTKDGVKVTISKHVARRYRERVEPNLKGWPEAVARIRYRVRHEAVVCDTPPEGIVVRETPEGRLSPRWLVLPDCVMPLRGRNKPKATTVIARG